MKALITGAASGLGLAFSEYLNELGHELILVDIDKERLEILQTKIKPTPKVFVVDLKIEQNVKSLYILTKKENIDILINCAAVGQFGSFLDIEMSKDIEIMDLNIKALHILTKQFLKDMEKKNSGYILNVSSLLGLTPTPYRASYAASKAYVLSLTDAISYELKKKKSKVIVASLTTGPIKTNFLVKSNVKYKMKYLEPKLVARYSIDNLLDGKTEIKSESIYWFNLLRRLKSKKGIMKTIDKRQLLKKQN